MSIIVKKRKEKCSVSVWPKLLIKFNLTIDLDLIRKPNILHLNKVTVPKF